MTVNESAFQKPVQSSTEKPVQTESAPENARNYPAEQPVLRFSTT